MTNKIWFPDFDTQQRQQVLTLPEIADSFGDKKKVFPPEQRNHAVA